MNELTKVGGVLLVVTIFFGWFGGVFCILAGFLLSIVLIAIGLTQPSQKEEKEKRDRYCPKCGRTIPFDANICPYCGNKFDDYSTYEDRVEELVEKNEGEKKQDEDEKWKEAD